MDATQNRILIVEDEVELAEIMRDYLIADGFAVNVASTGAGVVEHTRETPPDLMLLDLMLPEVDGISICKSVREFSDLPIIMVTAKVNEIDRVLGLDVGADDYICKPAKPREVVARVKAVLRRASLTQEKAGLECLECDDGRRQAYLVGEYLELSPEEFALLKLLNGHARRVCSRETLARELRGDGFEVGAGAIEPLVKKLRAKLSHASDIADPIRSVYDVGYVLELDGSPSDAYPGAVKGGGTG